VREVILFLSTYVSTWVNGVNLVALFVFLYGTGDI
jgi:hypothetical protein